MVPSVECGGRGWESFHRCKMSPPPFLTWCARLVDPFREFPEMEGHMPHLLRAFEKGLGLRPFSGESADVLLHCISSFNGYSKLYL